MSLKFKREIFNLPQVLEGKYRCGAFFAHTQLSMLCEVSHRQSARVLIAKIFCDRPQSNERWIQLFQEDVRRLQMAKHSQLISVVDGGVSEDWLYLILEQSSGVLLADCLTTTQRTLGEVRQFLSDIGGALSALHACGTVHGHLNPAAIFCEHDRFRLGGYCPESVERVRRHISGNSDFIFSPLTVAPEQVTNAGRSAATDIFALAALTYRLLAGSAPFEAQDALTTAMRRLTARPLPLSRLRRDVPAEMDAAILKALLRKPEERFLSIEDFVRACGVQIEGTVPLVLDETGNQLAQTVAGFSLMAANSESNKIQEKTNKEIPVTEALSRGKWSLEDEAENSATLSLQIEKEYINPDSIFESTEKADAQSLKRIYVRIFGATVSICLAIALAYHFKGEVKVAKQVASQPPVQTAKAQLALPAVPQKEPSGTPAVVVDLTKKGDGQYGVVPLESSEQSAAGDISNQVLVLDQNQQPVKKAAETSQLAAAPQSAVPQQAAAPQQAAQAGTTLQEKQQQRARLENEKTERENQINALLHEARRLKAVGRFVGPPGDNALEKIQKVRVLDPENSIAREFSYEMAAINIVLGDEARRRGDPETARAYFKAASELGVDRSWLTTRSDHMDLLERSHASVVIVRKPEGEASTSTAYLDPEVLEVRINQQKKHYGYKE